MKKVMVFGTFDGLHQGHLDFFRQAREYGDFLVAVIARDINVKKLKKHSAQKSELQRLQDLKDCKLVDQALLGYENQPYEIIEDVKPDVICLGYDQRHFADNLEAFLKGKQFDIKVVRLKPYRPEKFHSSIVNKK